MSRESSARVSVTGAMASHLAPAGLEVSVFDLVPERMGPLLEGGARAASTLRDLAERSGVLCVCVPDDDDVRAVLLGTKADGGGALEHLRKGCIVVIHSTVHPDTIAEVRRILIEHLDAR